MPDFDDPGPPPAVGGGSAGMCADHPELRAAFLCAVCGKAICTICAFSRTDGSRVCTACASTPAVPDSGEAKLVGRGYLPPEHVRFLKCVQHPNVAAVQVCRGCGAPMCATCEFSLPGDIYLCPKCVVAPPRRLSKSRKTLVISAYAVAAYGTIGLALFMFGAVNAFLDPVRDEAAIGLIFAAFLFLPAVVGAALGFSAIDKRLHNPPFIWIAAVWNALLLGLHLLFILIGHLKG